MQLIIALSDNWKPTDGISTVSALNLSRFVYIHDICGPFDSYNTAGFSPTRGVCQSQNLADALANMYRVQLALSNPLVAEQ